MSQQRIAATVVALAASVFACRGPGPALDERPFEYMEPKRPPVATATAVAEVIPRAPSVSPYERWHVALEAYTPRAAPGKASALSRDQAEAFARYVRALHAAVHPVFSQAVVELERGGAGDPANASALSMEMEITIDGATGEVTRLGVVRRSEAVDFDLVALDSVKFASPFAPVPEGLRSPDGNAYVRWVFRRDPNEGCSVRDARGVKLRAAPWPP